MTIISAPGARDQQFTKSDIDLGLLEQANPEVEPLGRLRIDPARASGGAAEVDQAGPDTIVELHLEGDLRWITTVRQLETDFPGQIARSATPGGDLLRLPTHLGRSALRGGGDGIKINGAAIFDIDIDRLVKELTGDPAATAGTVAGSKIGPKLAEWFDERQVQVPGLYRLEAQGDGVRLTEQTTELSLPDDGAPYLLFIHGTASTTEGSFGGLWDDNEDIWKHIRDRYHGRMLALEHRTLAVNPIANALSVITLLPKNARLHIVSHSRGGMIGELLCRSGRLAGELFDAIDFERFDGEGYEALKVDLMIFRDLLAKKEIAVERFVRVACPAAGTTLADGKLDRWLSAMMNVVGKIGADVSVVYRFVRGFLLAVVETRAEPEHIPGLEAMMPGSPLTRILNRPDIQTTADLTVIAGDIDGKGVLHRLGVWLTDLYYQGDHDLVVDTASMYGGMTREEGMSRSYFEDGPEVYHFRYFKNRTTAGKVWDGLRRPDPIEGEPADMLGFTSLPAPPRLKELQSRAGEQRPSVFMLPGILGSELGHDDRNRIWLDPKDILKGRLLDLAVDVANPRTIRVFDMLPRYYNQLANFLAASHDVLPFPYDWRISIALEAARFAEALSRRLEESSQPVRILAHSLGGLVARLAFAQDADLFQRFKARVGCRLVMLGTPSRGSFSIARMLMGKDKTTGLLALADFKNSEKDLLNMIRRFPGVLELLPADGPHDFFDELVWKVFDDTDGKGWQEPVGSDLVNARATWRLLDDAPIDGASMVYVAGQADSTPVALRIDGNRVRFQATAEGDGRVPWATGIPKEVPSFFAAAAHGDLPRFEPAFGAYLDLLQEGTTRLLRSTRPEVRGAAMPFDLPDDKAPIFPDAEALEAAALGGRARHVQTSRRARPLTVRLRHGDLAFSHFPVMVGHYQQDSLIGSEQALDKGLDGRLSARYQRDLYPGPIGTAEVILEEDAFPPGAIVIGLGQVGSLTPGTLKRAILHGLRRYCLTAEEWLAPRHPARVPEGDRPRDESVPTDSEAAAHFGLSTIIIGSGDAGMRIDEALTALLDALIELQRGGELGGLAMVEIIEYAEHRAIGAMRALTRLQSLPRFAAHIDIDPVLKEGEGGIRELVLEADKGWSQRIQITKTETSDQRYQGLHFAALTGRARIEDNVVADTLSLADAFIDAAVTQTGARGQASPGRTLFELLLPLRMKLVSDEDRNLVLMLDRFAASYPWELLEDKSADEAKPPAIRAGLIRQLHDERYRADVVTTNQRTALVVGDPEPLRPQKQFPALDGAVREARAVADLIGRAGYAVDEEIRTRPTAAIATLMSGPYRIVHLAGHGVFEQAVDVDDDDAGRTAVGRTETGMVLGDGLFLTVGAVNQLTHVPELVFLNCCYLGRIDARAESRAATRFHELAANLGTQFIRIGAKAVIAAGWAVDDDAANTFATTFYQQMLERRANFMDAVKEARRQTHTAHPDTNTWGAYQAYGDPAFTLNGKQAGGGGAPPGWHHPYEAVLAFEQLAQRAQTLARSDWAALKVEFHALWKQTPKAWWQNARILGAKAISAGELGLLADALHAYDRAIAAEKSDAPIKAIQQRANLRARYAVYLAKGKVARDPEQAVDPLRLIVTSLTELRKMTTLQALDASPDQEDPKERKKRLIEQLTFQGSAAKRAAQLYVRADKTALDLERDLAAKSAEAKILPAAPDLEGLPRTQVDWLKLSARSYHQAHEHDPEKAYALTNWLTISAVIALRGGKIDERAVQPPTGARLETLLNDADRTEHLADLQRPDFWALSAKGDIALTRLLLDAVGRLRNPKGERAIEAYEKDFDGFVGNREKVIAGAYLKAWQRGGSVLKMNSILEQLDTIIDALAIGQSDTTFERQRLILAVQRIQGAINEIMAKDD